MFDAFGLASTLVNEAVLGQRDHVLVPRLGRPDGDRPHRKGPGRGRRAQRVPARDRQPGPDAGAAAGEGRQVRLPARGGLRVQGPGRGGPRGPGGAGHRDPRGDGRGRQGHRRHPHREGPLRRRLRRRPHGDPHLDRPGPARGRPEPRLGRDGHPARHRLPGRAQEGRHPVRHRPLLHIPREGGYLVRYYVDLGDIPEGDRSIRERTTFEDILAAARRPCTPTPWTRRRSPGGASTRSASGSPTVSTT